MTELEELVGDINKLRENLYRLMEQRGYNLNDAEVLEASKNLNEAIVNYNSLIKKRMLD